MLIAWAISKLLSGCWSPAGLEGEFRAGTKPKPSLNGNLKNINKCSETNNNFVDEKCTIDDDDEILFGNGGSTAFIIITRNKRVYKFFTIYFNNNDVTKKIKHNIKNELKKSKNEINIYRLLTKHIIDKHISKHYVKMIKSNFCMNGVIGENFVSGFARNKQELFKKYPSYLEFLENAQGNKLCKEKMYAQKQKYAGHIFVFEPRLKYSI